MAAEFPVPFYKASTPFFVIASPLIFDRGAAGGCAAVVAFAAPLLPVIIPEAAV